MRRRRRAAVDLARCVQDGNGGPRRRPTSGTATPFYQECYSGSPRSRGLSRALAVLYAKNPESGSTNSWLGRLILALRQRTARIRTTPLRKFEIYSTRLGNLEVACSNGNRLDNTEAISGGCWKVKPRDGHRKSLIRDSRRFHELYERGIGHRGGQWRCGDI